MSKIEDRAIIVKAKGINKTLKKAIEDGDLSGGNGQLTPLTETTITVPKNNDYGPTAYVPGVFSATGTITNYTASAFHSRKGGELIVSGSVTFSAASSAFVGVFITLPSGLIIDPAKIKSPQDLGKSTALDAGVQLYQAGVIEYSNTTQVLLYTTNSGGANTPVRNAMYNNTYPVTFGAGDSIQFEFKVPIVGWSANETENKTIPLTMSGFTQDADSYFYGVQAAVSFGTTVNNGGYVARFPVTTMKGSDIVRNDSPELGTTFIAQRPGIYHISATFVNVADPDELAWISINGAGINYQRYGNSTANNQASLAASPYLNAGDVIRIMTEQNNTTGQVMISRQGNLKQVNVNPDQKATIETAELRFEGSTTRAPNAIVKFDTAAKVVGDAFSYTSDNTLGTQVTVLKAGFVVVSGTLYHQAAGGNTMYVSVAGKSSAQTTTSGHFQAASLSMNVAIGDKIFVVSDNAPHATGGTTNALNISWRSNQVAVAVTNTLPQFSESDSFFRLNQGNGFGSTNTQIRRYSNLLNSMGSDIVYNDPALGTPSVVGDSFTIKTSGLYQVYVSEIITAGAVYTAIIKNAVNCNSLVGDQLLASTTLNINGGDYASYGNTVYLAAGDVVRCATNNPGGCASAGQLANFSITKVGKPNVSVNVTPFVKTFVEDKGSIGEIKAFAGSVDENFFLACDGRTVPRVGIYSSLFDKIGVTYGAGDGSTTFKIPDLRGVFLRGLDGGRGLDTGRTLGSYQDDQLQGHRHTLTVSDPAAGAGNNGIAGGNGVTTRGANTDSFFGGAYSDASGSFGAARVGAETRPKNVSVNYGIRFKAAQEAILTENRTFTFRGYKSANQTGLTAVTDTKITFTKEFEVGDGWDAANNQYVIQETGKYLLNGKACILRTSGTFGASEYIRIRVYRNGNPIDEHYTYVVGGFDSNIAINGVYSFVRGDIIYLTGGSNAAYGIVGQNSVIQPTFAITKVQEGAMNVATINRVTARANQNTAQEILANQLVRIVYNPTKNFDPTNSMNAASGVFTAPEDGYYRAYGQVAISTAWTVGQYVGMHMDRIASGSSQLVAIRRTYLPYTGTYLHQVFLEDTTYLKKGDTLMIGIYQTKGTVNLFVEGNPSYDNYFTVTKVG